MSGAFRSCLWAEDGRAVGGVAAAPSRALVHGCVTEAPPYWLTNPVTTGSCGSVTGRSWGAEGVAGARGSGGGSCARPPLAGSRGSCGRSAACCSSRRHRRQARDPRAVKKELRARHLFRAPLHTPHRRQVPDFVRCDWRPREGGSATCPPRSPRRRWWAALQAVLTTPHRDHLAVAFRVEPRWPVPW